MAHVPKRLGFKLQTNQEQQEDDAEFGPLTATRDALDIYDFAGALEKISDLPSQV